MGSFPAAIRPITGKAIGSCELAWSVTLELRAYPSMAEVSHKGVEWGVHIVSLLILLMADCKGICSFPFRLIFWACASFCRRAMASWYDRIMISSHVWNSRSDLSVCRQCPFNSLKRVHTAASRAEWQSPRSNVVHQIEFGSEGFESSGFHRIYGQ